MSASAVLALRSTMAANPRQMDSVKIVATVARRLPSARSSR